MNYHQLIGQLLVGIICCNVEIDTDIYQTEVNQHQDKKRRGKGASHVVSVPIRSTQLPGLWKRLQDTIVMDCFP